MNRFLRVYGYAIVTFLITLVSISYLSSIVLMLVPIYAYIGIKYKKESIITVAIYSMLMVIIYGFEVAVLYIFTYAIFGVLIGRLIDYNMNSFRTLITMTLYVFFTNLLNLGIISHLSNESALDIFKKSYVEILSELSKFVSVDYNDIVESAMTSFVGIYFLNAILFSFAIYFIMKMAAKNFFNVTMESIAHFKIEGFRVSQFILFIVIIVLLKMYDKTYGELIFYSSVLALTSIYAIQGFSLVYWFVYSKFKLVFLSGFIAFVFTFIIPGLPVVAVLGFVDSIFDFRKV